MPLSFDASYYLNHRPDVLNFYVNSGSEAGTGLSWPAFAEQHYNTYGWKEGANPNAIFDTSEYLAANLDVLAAGVNPFTHYLTFGANEGREPSASFITFEDFSANYAAAYLAENPDLGAAGIDTPEEAYGHYVIYGQFEDRPGTPAPFNPGETFTLTTGLDQFVGTSGNDTFQGLAASVNPFDSMDGGAGNDTLNILGDLGAANFAGVSIQNVEVVNLSGNTTAFNASVFGAAAQQIWQIDTSADVTNVGATTTAGFRNTATASVGFVAAATSASVALDNIDDASTLNVDGINLTSLTVSGTVDGTAPTLTITTTEETVAPGNDGSNIATLTLNLSSDVDVDISDLLATPDLVTVNASGSTGDLTIDFSTSGNVVSSITTGSGNDTVTNVGSYYSDAEVVTVNLGAGDDMITIDDDITGVTANTRLEITLGAGFDVVEIEYGENIFDASEDEFENGIISVTDFNGAEDFLDLSGLLLNRITLTNPQREAIEGSDTLFDAVTAAAGVAAAADAVIFRFDGNTYLYIEDADAGFDSGDGLIELVGFTGSLDGTNIAF